MGNRTLLAPSLFAPSLFALAFAAGLLPAAPAGAELVTIGGVDLNGVEGASLPIEPVATFTDTSGVQPVADYSATINWGDGTSSPGAIVAAPGGEFVVEGGHTFAEEGSYSPIISISDIGGDTAAASDFANIADAPLTATGSQLPGVEGAPITGIVGKFTDGNPFGLASDFTATINWGDGTASTGTVAADPSGGFDVLGTHTYAEEGAYSPFFTVDDVGGSTASGVGEAIIADAPLTLVGDTVDGVAGSPFSGIVGVLTDANPFGTPGDYTATINWGDGSPIAIGTLVADPSGGFDILGTHTYAAPGDFDVQLNAQDVGGSDAGGIGQADISAAAVQAPEPATLSLLALAFPMLMLRRRPALHLPPP